MWRGVRLLHLRRLRLHPVRAAIAVVAVAAGVSLVVSVIVLSASTSRSLADFGRRLAGPAPLRVVGAISRGGLDQAVLAPVAATPGVAAAVPVVQAVTYAQDASGHLTAVLALGVDCRVQALFGSFGCSNGDLRAARPGAPPVLSAILARRLGAGAAVRTDLGRTRLDGAPTAAPLDRINNGNVAVFPLPVAQQLFDRQRRLDIVYVEPQAGVPVAVLRHRLQAVVGGWNGVLRATDPPPGIGIVTGLFVPLFGLLSLFALGIGGVLVFNTMSLSLEDRRRDLAVVGALGGTPATVVGGTMIEAVLLGLAGGVLGTAGGVALSYVLAAGLSDFTRKVAGLPITVHAEPASFVLGALLGGVVAAGAAWLPARRAARMDVAAELSRRDRRAEARGRLSVVRAAAYLSAGLLGVGVCWLAQRHGALQPWQASLVPVGVILSSVGFLLATGALAGLAAAGLRPLVDRAGAPARLGVANLIRDPGRTSVMTVAVGSAVAVAFLLASSHKSIHDGIAHSLATGNPSEIQVSTLPPNNTINIDAKPSPALIAALAAQPGVAAIDRGVVLLTGHDDAHLIGVSAFDHPWLNLPLIAGRKDRAYFERGNVLVGAALARREHLRPGSRLQLDTPTGFASVTIGGIWGDGNFNGRVVDMPMWLLQKLYPGQSPQSVGVIAAPGVGVGELAQRLRAAHLDPDLLVDTPAQMAVRLSRDIDRQLTPFDALQRGLLVVGFIAVLTTLLLVGAQRRRELGLLAAIGMEPAQLSGMTLAEAVAVGIIAVGVSVIGAVGMSIAFGFAIPILVGFHDPVRLNFSSLLVWGPVAVAVVVVAAALPAWRTSRLEVLEALQYE